MPANQEDQLRERLTDLRVEHRRLDTKIAELESQDIRDQLQITRLKKKKLALKDEIAAIEDRLFPDIIA
ncbi:MAG: YdcH family protein [Hyphomicrobiaceae bacterium]